jgi:Arc/MetJ family transcription regulator
MARVRTNIEIEERYLTTVMQRFGVRTKTEAVDLALRHLAGAPMTRDEALAMHGARLLDEVPPDPAPRASA